MMKLTRTKAVLAGLAATALAAPVLANNSWSTYHWLHTTPELTVQLGDNVDSRWDAYLAGANADWNASAVINSPLVAGSTNPKNCRAVAGTIQVCNSTYGSTGWLGIASISLSGGHISQGTTKLNDTYFNTASYNTPAWRRMVTCQEVGHDYGLAHQDETFTNYNLGTCMDYTNAPAGGTVNGVAYGPSNEHPNTHDYDQLNTIYSHFDAVMSTVFARGAGSAPADIGDTPATWGKAIHFTADGRPDVYQRIDGPGQQTITHVLWAIGEGPRGR
ncbi:MAG: hypothetical protein ABIR51_09165 [Sphingomicrobium sp.]